MKLAVLLFTSLFCINLIAKPAQEVAQEVEQEDCYEQCEDCLMLGFCGLFVASTSLVLEATAHKAILREDEASACFLGGFGMLSSILGKIELQNRNMAQRDARDARAKLLAEAKKTK